MVLYYHFLFACYCGYGEAYILGYMIKVFLLFVMRKVWDRARFSFLSHFLYHDYQ